MEVGYGTDRAQRLLRDRVQSRWMAAYDPIKHLDPVLVVTALALTGIGLLAIYSAKLVALTQQGLPTTTYISRQLLALVIGIAAMAVMAMVDYRHLRTYAPVLYVVSVFLLLVVLSPLGTEVKGSQRWLVVAGFQLQPSELAKIAVLVTVAAVLHELKGNIRLGAVAVGLGIAIVPTALVFLQPDLGTSLVFLWTVAVLFLIAGIPARYLTTIALGGLVTTIVALQTGRIETYQLRRLTSFLDAADPALAQGPAFQTYQSMVAIGSGQFAGKGLFQGTQTALSYVPENHTDFVFTVIGEEFGFVGASVVLGLFVLLVWRALRIAILAKDLFGTLLASGIIAILALQVFINVGMNVGIMPVTGLPLPFVSYGGTSLIVWFAMVGLLLNVHMRRF
jgi:rod shape determining protein RodA